jgi:hypothetical protein
VKIHPHDDVLEEFLLSLDVGHLAMLRHLQWCAYCRSRLAYLPREVAAEAGAVSAPLYEIALEETSHAIADCEATLERERDEAPGLFLELLEQPAEERETLLGASRFHTWGVFELLVERSLEITIQDSSQGETLGTLAVRLSAHLDVVRYGAERIADLQARAWAYIGNARRRRFDSRQQRKRFRPLGPASSRAPKIVWSGRSFWIYGPPCDGINADSTSQKDYWTGPSRSSAKPESGTGLAGRS